jgi:hypothetical protein
LVAGKLPVCNGEQCEKLADQLKRLYSAILAGEEITPELANWQQSLGNPATIYCPKENGNC